MLLLYLLIVAWTMPLSIVQERPLSLTVTAAATLGLATTGAAPTARRIGSTRFTAMKAEARTPNRTADK